MAYWIGLMSGTSLDGVDAVLMLDQTNANKSAEISVIAHSYQAFSTEFVVQLQSLQQPNQHCKQGELHQAQLAAITLVRDYCAPAIFDVLAQAQLQAADISAIGAHGQTIRHRPDLGFTVQLNAPALLAELTNITVVADFRSRDIAAGGQGAPLVPAFHQAVFSHPQYRRGILNLGGIANLTVLPTLNDEIACVLGYDIGPCNVLLNDWIEMSLHMAFDREGAWARQGQIIPALLDTLRTCEYLSRVAPKSTGRDDFNLTWLNQQIKTAVCADQPPANVMATLVAWMAECVSRECGAHQLSEVFVCGGGALNTFLMESIAIELNSYSISVNKTDVLGVPVMQVEALAFAWLAKQCIERKSASLPAVTGASGTRVLGAIYLA